MNSRNSRTSPCDSKRRKKNLLRQSTLTRNATKKSAAMEGYARCPASWMQQGTVRSNKNIWYSAIEATSWSQNWFLRNPDAQRRADPAGNHPQGGAHLQPEGL